MLLSTLLKVVALNLCETKLLMNFDTDFKLPCAKRCHCEEIVVMMVHVKLTLITRWFGYGFDIDHLELIRAQNLESPILNMVHVILVVASQHPGYIPSNEPTYPSPKALLKMNFPFSPGGMFDFSQKWYKPFKKTGQLCKITPRNSRPYHQGFLIIDFPRWDMRSFPLTIGFP